LKSLCEAKGTRKREKKERRKEEGTKEVNMIKTTWAGRDKII
jgi:hypothetical protein